MTFFAFFKKKFLLALSKNEANITFLAQHEGQRQYQQQQQQHNFLTSICRPKGGGRRRRSRSIVILSRGEGRGGGHRGGRKVQSNLEMRQHRINLQIHAANPTRHTHTQPTLTRSWDIQTSPLCHTALQFFFSLWLLFNFKLWLLKSTPATCIKVSLYFERERERERENLAWLHHGF